MVRYRKSKKAGPFRFTLSSRGISSSVGLGPVRFTRSARGRVSSTTRIAGFSTTRTLSRRARRRSSPTPGRRHHHAGRIVLVTFFALALLGRFPWLWIVVALSLVAVMWVKRSSAPVVVDALQEQGAPPQPAQPLLTPPNPAATPPGDPPIIAPRNGPFGTRFT